MRFRVQPRCVPPAIAARRLGLSPGDFATALPRYRAAGFPEPDISGNYDLVAIDRYLDRRNPLLLGGTDDGAAETDNRVFLERIAQMGQQH